MSVSASRQPTHVAGTTGVLPPQVARDFVAEAQAAPIANIGQIDHAGELALKRAIRRGDLVKWRGYWYPVAGARYGIGPLKTCYGTPADCARLTGIVHASGLPEERRRQFHVVSGGRA